jgi:hypothetical protein
MFWVKGYTIKTIHVQYTGTQQMHLYLGGNNIQFSTNTEKEQNVINNLISLSFCSQLFQRNGCKYNIQYYQKKKKRPVLNIPQYG